MIDTARNTTRLGSDALPLDAALSYAKRGWYVVPLHTPTNGVCSCRKKVRCGRHTGKHPRLPKGWPEKASKYPGQIRAWWKKWPDANVGILTGQLSGLVVVDVDVRDFDGIAGLEALVTEQGSLPDTRVVSTPSGGLHYCFRPPPGPIESGKIPGVGDFQADGRLVVGPGSLGQSGDYYTVLSDIDTLAELPDFLRPPMKEEPPPGPSRTQVNQSVRAAPQRARRSPYFSVPRDLYPKGFHLEPSHPDYGKELSEREALTDLLSMANHDARNGLPKDACDPSLSFLAERWNWDRDLNRVRSSLKKWVEEGTIAREKWPERKHIVTLILGVGEAKMLTPPATPLKSIEATAPDVVATPPFTPIEERDSTRVGETQEVQERRYSGKLRDDANRAEFTGPRSPCWDRQCEEARSIPILEIVARLGLGEPKREGKQYLVTCPFHSDARPSLSINAKKGVCHCFPCGFGGDGIKLWMRHRCISFAEAVREMTGSPDPADSIDTILRWAE